MTITSSQRKQISDVARAFHLELVLLFGSQARGTSHDNSDVDFAVLGSRELSLSEKFKIEGALQDIVGESVDVVDLKIVPVLLGDRIVQDAKVIVGDVKQFQRLRDMLHVRYMEYAPHFKKQRLNLYQHFGISV